MGEVGKKNIISVKLAIQRELIYRKKVANMFQSDDILKDLLPLQGPSSAYCQSPNASPSSWSELSSVTRARPCLRPTQFQTSRPVLLPSSGHQFPSSNPNLVSSSTPQFPASGSNPRLFAPPSQSLNPPYLVPSRNPVPRPFLAPTQNSTPGARPLACQNPSSMPRPFPVPSQNPSPVRRPCLTSMPSSSGFKRKTTGSLQYQAPQRRQPPQETYIVVDTTWNMFCRVCEVPCSGPFNLKQHLKGQKHMLKMNEKNKLPKCDLCQIWCSNEDALKMHFQGQKHKAKLQSLEIHQRNGERVPERPWCELCQISCMNEESFQQHLKGQKHIKCLYKMQENPKASEDMGTCTWGI